MASIMEQARELMKLWGGFRPARIMLTANNLEIFDRLRTAKTSIQVSKELKADPRGTEILLDALAGLGILRKTAGKYKNSEAAERFLVREAPYYLGDSIRHTDSLWKSWSGLDEAVKTGNPQKKSHDHESFIMAMHNMASLRAQDIVDAMDLAGVKIALDLGGGPGTYAACLAAKGIKVTLFDLPETLKISRRLLKGMKGMKLKGGDFISDDIGRGYDLVFISQIFHAYSEKDCLHLLNKSRAAMNRGGRIYIQEFPISEDRTSPPQSALFSVNMLVNTPGGRCYTQREMKVWLKKTGFSKIKSSIVADNALIEARV